MLRFAILVLVVVAILSAEARRPPRRKKGGKDSHEQDQLVEELAQKVDDLERRIERIGSTGATRDQAASSVDPSAAHGSCPNASPIHMHFHGANDEHDHDHGHGDTPDTHDTHVHIDLGLDLDAFHDFHRFKQRMHKHIDPEEEYSAKCVMWPVDPNSRLTGELEFKQHGKDPTVTVEAEFEELPAADTHYDLHVHVSGDMSNGCMTLGPHFDPFDPDVDVGDLGGVTSDSDKTVDHEFTGVRLSLFGPLSIVGRSAIIHDEKGDRMACCLIGWEHSPHDVADSHEAHGRAHGHGMDQAGKMQE